MGLHSARMDLAEHLYLMVLIFPLAGGPAPPEGTPPEGTPPEGAPPGGTPPERALLDPTEPLALEASSW